MDDGCLLIVLLAIVCVIAASLASLVAVVALVIGAVFAIGWLVAWLGYVLHERSAEDSNPSRDSDLTG